MELAEDIELINKIMNEVYQKHRPYSPALKLCWLTCYAISRNSGTRGCRTLYKKYTVNNRIGTIDRPHAPALKLCWLTSDAIIFGRLPHILKKYTLNNRVETIDQLHSPVLKICWLTGYAYNFRRLPHILKKYTLNNRIGTIDPSHAPALKLCGLTGYAYPENSGREAGAHFIKSTQYINRIETSIDRTPRP